jgi:hypothetical protein
MKRPTPGQILLVLAGIGVLVFAGLTIIQALRSDETRVRMVLEDVQTYARRCDPGAVMEYVDPAYRDSRGHTFAEVQACVRYCLLQAKSIDVVLTPLRIDIAGDVATVRAKVVGVVTLSSGTAALRDAGFRGETFDVVLKRHGSYFRAVSIEEAGAGEGEAE